MEVNRISAHIRFFKDIGGGNAVKMVPGHAVDADALAKGAEPGYGMGFLGG